MGANQDFIKNSISTSVRLCLEFCREYSISSTDRLEELINFRQIKSSKIKTEIFIQLMLIISKTIEDIKHGLPRPPNRSLDHDSGAHSQSTDKARGRSINSRQREALRIAGHLKRSLHDDKKARKRESIEKTIHDEQGRIYGIVEKHQADLQNIDISSIGRRAG